MIPDRFSNATDLPYSRPQVGGAVLRLSRLIKLEEGGEKRQYGDVSWTVPKGVGVNQDLKGGKGKGSFFPVGPRNTIDTH